MFAVKGFRMKTKPQLLIIVLFLLFGVVGCREDNSRQKHDSTISLSGGGKTSIRVNNLELRVENGQLFLNEQVLDIPEDSEKLPKQDDEGVVDKAQAEEE